MGVGGCSLDKVRLSKLLLQFPRLGVTAGRQAREAPLQVTLTLKRITRHCGENQILLTISLTAVAWTRVTPFLYRVSAAPALPLLLLSRQFDVLPERTVSDLSNNQ